MYLTQKRHLSQCEPQAAVEGAKEYSDIKADYNHVAACCMWMVKNPEYYDVIVSTNMFGDIITDLAGILQGGMGVARGTISTWEVCNR